MSPSSTTEFGPLKYGLLIGGLLFKLAILMTFGPFIAPDTIDYMVVTDAIVSNPQSFHEIPDWQTAALPKLAFRPLGYPMLVAGAQFIGGTHFQYWVVAIQILLSVAVAGLLCDVAFGLTRSRRWAALATILYFISETALWDNEILSDSLYASLFGIVVLVMARSLLRQSRLSPAKLVLLGVAWALSILVRDNGLYFTVVPFALLAASAARTGVFNIGKQIALFLVPVILILAGYESWNAHRTGERFISVTSAANYLQPVFAIKRKGYADPFDGPEILDVLVRTSIDNYDYPAQFVFLQRLHDALGLKSPIELGRITLHKYIQTIVRHPLAYTALVLQNLDPRNAGEVLFDPLFIYNDFFQIGVPPYERVVPGSGFKSVMTSARDGHYGRFALAVLSGVASTAAAILWVGVTIVLCIRLVREYRTETLSRVSVVAGLMLAAFWWVSGIFALSHTEARYALPIIAPGLCATVFVLASAHKRPVFHGLDR